MQSFPEPLKHIVPYIKRAAELEEKHPVFSYYCNFYVLGKIFAVQKANNDPEVRDVLMAYLDICETLKSNLPLTDDDHDSFLSFAVGIFKNAHQVDMAGAATAKTAQTYFAASHFLEVYSVFDKDMQKVNSMKIFAKKRAGLISSSLKAGIPIAPPPGGKSSDGVDVSNEMAELEKEAQEEEEKTPHGEQPTIGYNSPTTEYNAPTTSTSSPEEITPVEPEPVVQPAQSSGFGNMSTTRDFYKDMAKVQSNCRAIISAIDFEDLPEAKRLLEVSLAMVNNHSK
ncbi:hypothetical protein PCE1_002136 [Barthelona sp. PCE]